MLIFLTGTDTYRNLQQWRAIRARFLEKFDPTGINVSEFPAAGASGVELGEVQTAVMSLPFLSPKRLVLVRDALGARKKKVADANAWAELLQRIPESAIIVIWESLPAKEFEAHPVFTETASVADRHVYAFDPLPPAQAAGWAVQEAQRLGASLDHAAASELVSRAGAEDLWRLSNEVQKLASASPDGVISISQVQEQVRAAFDDQMFAFIDAVATGARQQAAQLLFSQRQAGVSDGQLLSMLLRQVRLLLAARGALDAKSALTKDAVAKQLSVHPFVAQKALAQARRFQAPKLVAMYRVLFDCERGAKSGAHDFAVAVDRSVAEMVG